MTAVVEGFHSGSLRRVAASGRDASVRVHHDARTSRLDAASF
jgi:hypothetical protein